MVPKIPIEIFRDWSLSNISTINPVHESTKNPGHFCSPCLVPVTRDGGIGLYPSKFIRFIVRHGIMARNLSVGHNSRGPIKHLKSEFFIWLICSHFPMRCFLWFPHFSILRNHHLFARTEWVCFTSQRWPMTSSLARLDRNRNLETLVLETCMNLAIPI